MPRVPLCRELQQLLTVRLSVVLSIVILTLAPALWAYAERACSAAASSTSKQPLVRPARVPSPIPIVDLEDVPAEVFVGEDFTFSVTFDNSSTVGFGPFIDLVLDSGGADHNNPLPSGVAGPCDGIQFVKAEMVDLSGGPVPLTAQVNTAPCTTSPAPLAHPFGASPFGPITVSPGAQLVTVTLPFGSYQPTQPKITIKVTAHMHTFADLNHQLSIYARGGFQFGGDAQNNPGSDPPVLTDTGLTPALWVEHEATTPILFVESKTYLGTENETATGPNFPRQYEITVDIANGQTVNNLVVTDCMSSQMQYVSLISATPAATPAATSPCLQFNYSSLTGVAGPDIKIVFSFFIRKNVGGKTVLNPKDCKNPSPGDDVKIEGDWPPPDPRDGPPPLHVVSNKLPIDHSIVAKRLAVQKLVEIHPTPNSPLIPGGFLKYTINFQVSDFFTVGNIEVEDILSDGQGLITLGTLAPKLTVSDLTGPTPTTVNFTPGTHGPSLFTTLDANASCEGVTSGRRITFRISTAMRNSAALFTSSTLQNGILTGGHASGPPANVPAIGQIVFYARILDSFVFPRAPGTQSVDKHDPLSNCVTIRADMVEVDLLTKVRCADDSKTSIEIPGGVLSKIVYARNGSTTDPELSNSPPHFAAGDTITFRITQTIPSGDYEDLTISDWLPVPVLSVSGLAPGPVPACTSVPPAGSICRFMPGHTLPVTPTLAVSPSDNSFELSYGSGNDPSNQIKTIDLLVTLTLTLDPFADELFLSNKARECERNTFGKQFCQNSFATFKLTEPNVRIRKGVIATNNPNSVFMPAPPPGPGPANVTFTAQIMPNGSNGAPIWSPLLPIDSNGVNHPNIFNSDLFNADAGDWITFAILLENRGSGLNGAFDVKFRDTISPGFLQPPPTYIMPAHDGTAAAFSIAPPAGLALISSSGVELVDPGPTVVDAGSLDRFNLTGGRNLAIATYNVQINPAGQITIGDCLNNIAELVGYSAAEGGPNFVTAGYTPPFMDTAKVCINPTLVKSIVGTSEAHTAPETSAQGTPQIAVGEIVRYRLVVRLPEGTGPNFQLTDALPPGLKFMNDNTARLAFISTNGSGITHTSLSNPAFDVSGNETTLPSLTFTTAQAVPSPAINVGANCGDDVTFNLGPIQNNDNDPDLEYVVIEFNALACNVLSNQQPLGQTGTTLSNTFSASVGGNQIATSNAVNVNIVEPNVVATKVAAPATAGTANFTLTLTNTGAVTAFDVNLTDVLPAGLSFTSAPVPAVSASPVNCAQPALTLSGNSITVTTPKLPASSSCTITLTFSANVPATCPAPSPNIAQVIYTSLPGSAGTVTNNTGSVTPGTTGAMDGERPYNTFAWAAVPNNCPPQCALRPPNMVSWWPLNEQPGAIVVADIAGTHNGTPLPNFSVGLPNGPPSVPGIVSSAFGFGFTPPIPYNVSVPDTPSLRFGTTNLTIDTWFNTARFPPLVVGVVDKLDLVGKKGYAFYFDTSHLTFVMGDGNSFITYTSNALSFSIYTWHHIAVTVDRAGVGTFYFDGVQVGTFTPLTAAIDISSSTPLFLGGSRFTFTSPNCVCEYTLDEIEIFQGVVSANDIRKIFEAGSAGKCP